MSSRNPIAANGPTTGSAKPRSGTAERRRAFAQAYIANGHNATQAAITAGFSPKGARVQGVRMLTNAHVQADLANLANEVASVVGLEIKRTVQEVARLSYFDPQGLLDRDGKLLPLEKMPADVRACIASMDFDPDTGRLTKVRFWDKNAALEKAMRHHGLYEKDNSQKGESVKVQVLLVGPQ